MLSGRIVKENENGIEYLGKCRQRNFVQKLLIIYTPKSGFYMAATASLISLLACLYCLVLSIELKRSVPLD